MAKYEKKVNLYTLRYRDNNKLIDWKYYTKFYPDKKRAIQVLRNDTGYDLKKAKEVIEEIFTRIDNGKVVPNKFNAPLKKEAGAYKYVPDSSETNARKDNLKKAGSNVAKGVGLGVGTALYIGFGTLFKLTGKYSKKRK